MRPHTAGNLLSQVNSAQDVADDCSAVAVSCVTILSFDLHTLKTSFCRFMSIAEQMGRALQRTSVSVNIKERLDFSCAVFSPDGTLVANAPHLPVHLGAMSEAVRAQIAYYKGAAPLKPRPMLPHDDT